MLRKLRTKSRITCILEINLRGGFELSPLMPGAQSEIDTYKLLSGETITWAHFGKSHF